MFRIYDADGNCLNRVINKLKLDKDSYLLHGLAANMYYGWSTKLYCITKWSLGMKDAVMFHKHCFVCIQKIHQYNSWLAIIFIPQEVCVHNVWADVVSSTSCLIKVSGEATAKFHIGFWRTASHSWWPGPWACVISISQNCS